MTKSQVSPPPTGAPPSYSSNSPEWDLIELSPVFDLQDILSIIKKRIFLLLLFPFAGAVAAIIYLFFFATLYYSSTALILVDPKFDRILMVENINSVASDLDSLNSLERAMTSDSMILRVIDKLNLREDRDFLPKAIRSRIDKGKPVSDSLLLKEIRNNRVSCGLIKPTRLLEVTVYDTDAERARLIAQTFVTEFEGFLGDQKKLEAERSQEALRRQAGVAYQRALDAEKDLERFRINNPGVTVEQDHELFADRLTRAGEEYNEVSSKVLSLQSKVETVKDIDPAKSPLQILEIGEFSDTGHVTNLLSRRMEAKAAFATVGARYTQSHPEYARAEKDYIEAEAQLVQMAVDLKETLIGEYNAAVKNEKLLAEKVMESQVKFNSVKAVGSEFRAIKQKTETEWRIHEALQQQISETALLSEKSTSIATRISEPIAAHKTSKPGKPVVTLIGGFLGCLVSLGFLGLDLFRDSPFVNRKQIEENLGVKVLAETPKLDSPDAHRKTLLSEMSQVLLSPQHRLSKVIHVTSVEASKTGKHISNALGYASAYYGNPTLVITMIPGASPNTLVSFKPTQSNHENLYSLTIPSSFLLAPENIWQALNPHCRHFSRIIIETSALEQNSQVPLMVSAHSDTTVLIVRNGVDRRRKIDRVLDSLRKNARGEISVTLEG